MKRSNRITHCQHGDFWYSSVLFEGEAGFYFSDLMTIPYKISDALSFEEEPPKLWALALGIL